MSVLEFEVLLHVVYNFAGAFQRLVVGSVPDNKKLLLIIISLAAF